MAVNVDLAEGDLDPLDVEEFVASLAYRAEAAESPRVGRVLGPIVSGWRIRNADSLFGVSFFSLAFVLLADWRRVISNRISKVAGRRGSHARA